MEDRPGKKPLGSPNSFLEGVVGARGGELQTDLEVLGLTADKALRVVETAWPRTRVL